MDDTSWVAPALGLARSGALQTVIIALASVALSVFSGVVLGVLLCLPQGRWNDPVCWLLNIYLQVFRGLPVLVTLFIVFFISPSAGLQLSSTSAAILGLSLWGSSNVMEVVRGAVRSIPTAQFEAARALGFRWRSVMRLVILPQATARMIPPVVNLTVDLIQATTLASLIGVIEVLQRSRQTVEYYQLSAGDGHAAPVFGGVLVFFFLICYPLTVLAGRLERGARNGKSTSGEKPSRSMRSQPVEVPQTTTGR